MEKHWQQAWTSVQSHPQHHLILTLVALNGLSLAEAEAITDQSFNVDQQAIRTPQATYPLLMQTQAILDTLTAPFSFEHGTAQRLFDDLSLSETDAHRRLAGAIWLTSRETLDILQLTNTSEAPILPLRFTFPFSIVGQVHPIEHADMFSQSRETLQHAADWLTQETIKPKRKLALKQLLLQGSTIFLISNLGVNGLNFLHNLVMGRLLSPQAYGQLSLLITLQLFLGIIPAVAQTVNARYGSRYLANNDLQSISQLQTFFRRTVVLIGIASAMLFLISSGLLATIFQIDKRSLFIPLGVAIPFFFLMGSDRGLLQTFERYHWLSAVYVSESTIRLGVGFILVLLLRDSGTGLDGAVWAVGQAMFITWFIGWLAMRHISLPASEAPLSTETRVDWQNLAAVTSMALLGQALITNSDFLLVKNLFSPDEAGLYAAVSVLGRIAYFGVLPLTILVVPMVAKQQALGYPTSRLLMLLLGGGIAICGTLVIGSSLFPKLILGLMFGDAYTDAANLLPAYTFAASLFVMTNLIITYQIALGRGGETWMPFVASGLQVIAILLFHRTLQQVIIIQIILMALLLSGVMWRVFGRQALQRH
ncbi:MAG: hypothetical protein H6673_05990 [Anaerolineales bacterium]|nr:hypothetical protein [Anaerolineales bacterium]